MIATGTDIKPLEIVFFMRAVKSRNFFEQMKGRGVRVINAADFQAVTPGRGEDRFVIVDAVGVCDTDLAERSARAEPGVAFERLLQSVRRVARPEILSSLAGRLARLDRRIGAPSATLSRCSRAGRRSPSSPRPRRGARPRYSRSTRPRAGRRQSDAEPAPADSRERRALQAAAAPLAANPRCASGSSKREGGRADPRPGHQGRGPRRRLLGRARSRRQKLVASFEAFIRSTRTRSPRCRSSTAARMRSA